MFLKVTKQKNGRVNLSFVEGYRDPKTKKTRHKVIENLGYVDEYLDIHEDPEAHFRQVALNLNEKNKNKKNRIKPRTRYF